MCAKGMVKRDMEPVCVLSDVFSDVMCCVLLGVCVEGVNTVHCNTLIQWYMVH